jgi:5,10-methylenetetrahydromethanopterin reductase
MRETVEIIRALLAGREASWQEETLNLAVHRKCFIGAIPPTTAGIAVYMGASGPRMCQLVGEIGDGLLLGTGTGPDEIPPLLEHLATGASRAHRDANLVDVAAIVVASVSEDGSIDENTLCYAAKQVATLDEVNVQRLRFDPEQVARIRVEYQQGNCRSASSMLSREMVSTFTAAGTPEDCLLSVERFARAGVDLPILLPFGGDVNAVIAAGSEYLRRA